MVVASIRMQYQCEYLLFRQWIQVFSPMSDRSLQHKEVLPELNKLRLRQNRQKLLLRRTAPCEDLSLVLTNFYFENDLSHENKNPGEFQQKEIV